MHFNKAKFLQTTIAAATPLYFNSSNNLVSFRLIQEAAGNAIMYGWRRISLSAIAIAQPHMIVKYASNGQ